MPRTVTVDKSTIRTMRSDDGGRTFKRVKHKQPSKSEVDKVIADLKAAGRN